MRSTFDASEPQALSIREKFLRITLGIGILVLFYSMGTTLAANIGLGSSTTEFGQGIVGATACDNQIVVKPIAFFDNAATPNPQTTPASTGVFLLKSIAVTDVDSVGCDGKWLTFKAFNSSSSSPLEAASGLASFSVLNTSGTYSTTQGGFTVTTNSSSSFTIEFSTPVSTSSVVSRVTLESTDSSPAPITVTFAVGDVGPGGGRIFFVSETGFSCGSAFTSTGSPIGDLCHYLEAAPATWSGGANDPSKVWATAGYTTTDIVGISNNSTAYNNAAAIGLGYKNSVAIVNQGSTSLSAAGAARAYTGGGKSDWYLPTTAELNLLCQWARGVTQNVAVTCSGGSNNAAFFTDPAYWSSSEVAADQARVQYFNSSGAQDGRAKGDNNKVRPIRAF